MHLIKRKKELRYMIAGLIKEERVQKRRKIPNRKVCGGPEWISVVGSLPSMCKVLGSSPSLEKERKRKKMLIIPKIALRNQFTRIRTS